MAQEMVAKDKEEADVFSESLSGTDDWTNETFTCTGSMLLNYIMVEKPSTSIVQMEATLPNGGATALLFVSGAGVTSGVYDEQAKMVLPPLTVLKLTSTGGVSGSKVVSVVISRADV